MVTQLLLVALVNSVRSSTKKRWGGREGSPFANGYDIPGKNINFIIYCKNINFIIYSSGEEIHAHNEEIRKDGIPLSDTSSRMEEINYFSIHKDEDRRSSDTRHDKRSKPGRDFEEVEGLPNEGPFQYIKSFF